MVIYLQHPYFIQQQSRVTSCHHCAMKWHITCMHTYAMLNGVECLNQQQLMHRQLGNTDRWQKHLRQWIIWNIITAHRFWLRTSQPFSTQPSLQQWHNCLTHHKWQEIGMLGYTTSHTLFMNTMNKNWNTVKKIWLLYQSIIIRTSKVILWQTCFKLQSAT